MADIDMTQLNENLKQVGRSVDAMRHAARDAANAISAFVSQHHDAMNAQASAEVLKGMGRPDLAAWYRA